MEKFGPNKKLQCDPFIKLEITGTNLDKLDKSVNSLQVTNGLKLEEAEINSGCCFFAAEFKIESTKEFIEIAVFGDKLVGKQFLPINYLDTQNHSGQEESLSLKLLTDKRSLQFLDERTFELFYYDPEESTVFSPEDSGKSLNRPTFHHNQVPLHELLLSVAF